MGEGTKERSYTIEAASLRVDVPPAAVDAVISGYFWTRTETESSRETVAGLEKQIVKERAKLAERERRLDGILKFLESAGALREAIERYEGRNEGVEEGRVGG